VREHHAGCRIHWANLRRSTAMTSRRPCAQMVSTPSREVQRAGERTDLLSAGGPLKRPHSCRRFPWVAPASPGLLRHIGTIRGWLRLVPRCTLSCTRVSLHECCAHTPLAPSGTERRRDKMVPTDTSGFSSRPRSAVISLSCTGIQKPSPSRWGGSSKPGCGGGNGVVVIATVTHPEPLLSRLGRSPLDADACRRSGQLRILYAEAAPDRFMRNGMPDWTDFRRAIGSAIEGRTRSDGTAHARTARW
jgi:hypothetical protein